MMTAVSDVARGVKEDHCADAEINVISTVAVTDTLLALGLRPYWAANHHDYDASHWALRTEWTDSKHHSVENQLRFWLPEALSLNSETLLFLDDDIVVQGSIEDMARFELEGTKETIALASPCDHWIWTATGFQLISNPSIHETGYLGPIDQPCDDPSLKNCARRPLVPDLVAATHDALGLPAFSMGTNVINVRRWKELGLTRKYEAILARNNEEGWFPPNSLAFGMGLGLLLLAEHNTCFDDDHMRRS
jgi:lipopolysaccharide biosynthesis glycosyltransferase